MKGLVKCFYQPSIESDSWLIDVLDGVITKSKKRGMISQDKHYSSYHQLNISESENGLNFWGIVRLIMNPHITDELFKLRIKEKLCPLPEPDACSEDNVSLTFEEENAICYVGGYVIHSLKQQKKHEDIFQTLEEP